MKKLSPIQEDFVASGEVREISSRIAAAAGSGVEERWVEIDGARMRYLRCGSGPALILLHGLLGYSFSWRYTMPGLAPYATVYAPDMLGAGFSDRAPDLDYSMRATARRVLQFIDRLGISSFDLLGTSHGGAVSMMAADQCLRTGTPRLKHLVLVSPVNPYSPHGRRLAPFFASPVGERLFRLAFARTSFFYAYFHRRLYADRRHLPPGALAGYMAPLAIPGLFEHALRIVRTWTQDLCELQSLLPRLADVPTLLIWGKKDPAVYASSAGPLARHFRNCRVTIFPGIGHLPYEECPDEFNGALIQFLAAPPATV